MNSKKPKSKNLTLDELVFGALSQLQVLKYNSRSIRRYQSTWKRLITFAKKHKFKNQLCEKLILGFREANYHFMLWHIMRIIVAVSNVRKIY